MQIGSVFRLKMTTFYPVDWVQLPQHVISKHSLFGGSMQIRKVVRKTAEVGISMTILGTLLAGCLGSDGSGPVGAAPGTNGVTTNVTTSATSGFSIEGVAVKGWVEGGKASAYEYDSKGKRGRKMGEGSTSAGKFKIQLDSKPTTPVGIEVDGGSYKSEKDGSTVNVTRPMLAILPSVTANTSGVAVTPLTDMSAKKALANAASGVTLTTAIDDADKFISKTFGLSSTSPSKVIPDFTATALTANSDAGKVALAIAAIDGLAANLASGVSGLSRDDVYAALSDDYTNGLPDAIKFDGTKITITSVSGGASATLPATALGFDLAAEVAAVSPSVFSGATTSTITTAAPSVTTPLVSIVTAETNSTAGYSSSSSGAISYAQLGTKQYIFVAARTKGVQKIDVTDPTKPVVLDSASGWAGATLKTNFAPPKGGSSIGGAMIVTGSTGVQLLVYDYTYKHIALVNPKTGAVNYEGDLSLKDANGNEVTSGVTFSGASNAFIAGAIPVPGKGAWLATAIGYVFLDVDKTLAAGSGSAPVLGADKYAVPSGSNLSENLGGDISRNLLFTPNSLDLGIVNLSTTGSLTTPGYYKLDSAYATSKSVPSGYKDGGTVDINLGVGIISYEHTSNLSFINLNGLAPGATANTFKPSATNDFVDVVVATGASLTGTAVDSTTHQFVGFDANSGSRIVVGKLEDPATVASGQTWKGMSDWVYVSTLSLSGSGDPHAIAAVNNLTNGKGYGYVMNGYGTGVKQIDMAAMIALTRSGSSGDAAHTLATGVNPEATGGAILDIPTP